MQLVGHLLGLTCDEINGYMFDVYPHLLVFKNALYSLEMYTSRDKLLLYS